MLGASDVTKIFLVWDPSVDVLCRQVMCWQNPEVQDKAGFHF